MKKNLLTVLILALVIVNIALTGVMMFSVMNTNKKTAELVTNIATVMNLELTVPGEKEPVQEVSLADTKVYNLSSSMTVLLTQEDGEQSYMMFDVSLFMDTKNDDYKKLGEEITERESLIKDTISSVVGSHTESECRTDMEGLKSEILEAIQELFKSDFVYKVGVTEVKFAK